MSTEVKLDEELDMGDPKVKEYIKSDSKERIKNVKKTEEIPVTTSFERAITNDVVEEIEIDSLGITVAEQAEWHRKFSKLVDKNIIALGESHKETNKIWKKIRRREWFNSLFRLLHIPFRFKVKKEYNKVKTILGETFSNCFLHMNGLDNESIEDIEEMRKDRSIEGIRKQLPHILFH